MVDAVSIMNTGGKYDSKAFKKSVGLNGVGTKAVNALSSSFIVQSFRDGQSRRAVFAQGKIVEDSGIFDEPNAQNGTYVYFVPDNTLFLDFVYKHEFIETMLRNYAYLNTGLSINFNGKRILSKNGLTDLLNENMTSEPLYPIIHLKGEDIEIAFTHSDQYGEEVHPNTQTKATSEKHGGVIRSVRTTTITTPQQRAATKLRRRRMGSGGRIEILASTAWLVKLFKNLAMKYSTNNLIPKVGPVK
jgi:topoisomerase-4 subunit B